MKLDRLYKRDTTGDIRVWYMQFNKDAPHQYRTVAGKRGGKLVTSEWKSAEPKNVGRSNATTAEEQAKLEVKAKYKEKLAQGGYSEAVDTVDEEAFFKPMLAATWKGWDENWNSIYVQPKLDGIRCIADKDGLWTRRGKRILACPHIHNALKPIFKVRPDVVLDGELYNHDLADDFNKLVSLIRKSVVGRAELDESRDKVEYHMYDVYSEQQFSQRIKYLDELMQTANLLPCLQLVHTREVFNPQEVDQFHSEAMLMGYEGSMVRVGYLPYQKGKRSKSLLKRKEFITEEFEIVRIEEGKGNRSGMAGAVHYTSDHGEFGSGIKGGVAVNREIWKNREKLVGGTGTVRFFEYTPDGVPRFPVTIDVHQDGRVD